MLPVSGLRGIAFIVLNVRYTFLRDLSTNLSGKEKTCHFFCAAKGASIVTLFTIDEAYDVFFSLTAR